ncbi:MAG TPA: ROK family transcriptional regulator [Bryobacteraceae bacterium]|nr:ROK family transcriptional regulator [Bryobacteraceae bacterium]
MSSEQTATPHTATPESVREVNRAILLGLTRRFEPLSRAELSRRSGIFPSSVSRIVEGLIEDGLLTEERAVPTGRGKVPMLLRIRDEYFQVLGIHIQPVETTVAFAGFSGEIHRTWSFPTPPDPAEFIPAASRMIRSIAQEVRPPEGGIRHIGIGVPGFVDAAEGRITSVSTLLDYSLFPLASELHRATGIPVSIDNDCNLGALSELRRMQSRQDAAKRDFLFVSIGDYGVGAGLILGGELYRGHDSRFAAEVGHIIVDVNGPPCSCGRRGCLEKYIANTATWRRYKPRAAFSRDGFREMLRDAADGKAKAAAAVRETARYIALAASNLTSVLNPAEIVLAGEITEAFPLICEAVETLFRSPFTKVNMRRSLWPREAPLLHGAVCLALSRATPTLAFGMGVDTGSQRPNSGIQCPPPQGGVLRQP